MINFNTDISVAGDVTFTGSLNGKLPDLVLSPTVGNALIKKSDGYYVAQAAQGPIGPKGDKGDKGDTGATGPAGAQGAAGSDGHLFGLGNGTVTYPNYTNSTTLGGNRFLALLDADSPVSGSNMVGIALQNSSTDSSQFFLSTVAGTLRLRARTMRTVNGTATPGAWVTVYTDQEPPPSSAVDLSNYVPNTRTINGKNLKTNISLTASDVSAYSKTESDARYMSVNGTLSSINVGTVFFPTNTVNANPSITSLVTPSSAKLVLNTSSGTVVNGGLDVSTGTLTVQGEEVYSPSNPPPSGLKSTSIMGTIGSTADLDLSLAKCFVMPLGKTNCNVTLSNAPSSDDSLIEVICLVQHTVANSTVTFPSNVKFNDTLILDPRINTFDIIVLNSYDSGSTWYAYVANGGVSGGMNTVQIGNGFTIVAVKSNGGTVPVTSVAVSPKTFSKVVGGTQQLTATVLPADATNKAVTYATSNSRIATVSSTGLVTTVAAGSATITVTSTDGSFKDTATCTVTSAVVPVTSVTITNKTISMVKGETSQIVATVLPANATTKTVTYSSSNTAIATVSSTGLVTSVASGSATITVTTTSGGFTDTAAVTVTGMVTGNMYTSGRNILDKNGNTVKLKSVNWFGAESTNYVPHGIWQVSYKALIDQIASLGFNTIRMPFSGDTFKSGMVVNGINTSVEDNWDFILSGDPTKPNEVVFKDAFTCMDYIVNYAASKNLYIVFDHHRRSAGAGADGSPIDGSYTLQNWITTWTNVANHYKTFPNVIGADVHNEPHDLDWNTWAGYAEQAGNAILTAAPNWLIMVEGVGQYNSESYWWGGMLKGVATRPIVLNTANKVVYSPHEYGQSVGTQAWLQTSSQSVTNYPNNLPAVFQNAWGFIAEQNIAPLWIGEFGGHFGTKPDGTSAPNQTYEEQWLAQLETYINTYGVNYSYWCLNPNSVDTGGLLMNDWVTLDTHKVSLLQPILS